MHAGVLALVAAGSFGAINMDTPVPIEPQVIEHGVQEQPESVIAPFEMANLVVERLSATNEAPLLVSVSRSYPFVWPAMGPITSYMGSAHPTGIDIGLDINIDTPVFATAAGVVTFVGGTDYESYGLRVEIDHGHGLTSLYAHLDETSVHLGQSVQQGDILGLGGNTGKSFGKHLHFEVLDQGQRYDPLRLLPDSLKRDDRVSVDCGSNAIVVHHGSSAVFDFSVPLGTRSIDEVALQPLGERTTSAPVWAERESRSTIVLATQPSLGGPEERFMLTVTTAGENPTAMQCEVILKPMLLSPSYYVRTLEPTPVRTATPVPVAVKEEDAEEVAGVQATAVPPTPTQTATPATTVTPTVTATPAGSVTPATTLTPAASPSVTATPPAATPTLPAATPTPQAPAATPTRTP